MADMIEAMVSTAELIEHLSDEQIMDEMYERKLWLRMTEEEMYDVQEAYEELLRGRPAAAKSILERMLFPKWGSSGECNKAYIEVMNGTS